MAGWYELNKNDKGRFTFVLKASNGEVILRSEVYESRAGADKGIASVQENSQHEAAYTHSDASDGRFYFNLKASNHLIIGTSQMYTTAGARRSGMESVRSHGATRVIKSTA